MRPTRLQLAREVLLEGAVVAQPGERVGDGHLGQALDLGRAGGVEAAAVAHDDGAEEGEQQQPDARRRRRSCGSRAPRRGAGGALGERDCAGGGGLAVDDVREHAEDRIDRLVVEAGRAPASPSSTASKSAWLAPR